MALNGNVLGDAMKAAIDALSDADKADRTKVFRAMGAAVVAHIQANATVAVTVVSVSGVTPGGGVSGAGTGTGTVA